MEEEFEDFKKAQDYLSEDGTVDLTKLPIKLKYKENDGGEYEYEEGEDIAMPLTHTVNKLFFVLSKQLLQ